MIDPGEIQMIITECNKIKSMICKVMEKVEKDEMDVYVSMYNAAREIDRTLVQLNLALLSIGGCK